ncbi:hypothetical protein BX600DRAFT_152170 [Xylariales sp. PMI_506]|nr:hypothetical protein BX600DRAFT_152170 [Xylariales sp. PMI_506]
MTSAAERYDSLVQWVKEAGGSLHGVEVAQIGDMKGSLRATQTVNNGDVVISLPLSRTLSYLNAIHGHPDMPDYSHEVFKAAPNSSFFPVEFLKSVPPHVIGRFVLMQQYLLGRDSKWWPYIRSLPQPEHMGGMLPALWPQDDIEFLEGTNADFAIQEIKSTLKKEYKQAVKLLPDSFRATYTRPLYLWAYGIFTSRSFRPSLVIPDADTMELPCAIDDFAVLLPLYDLGNHSPAAKTSWLTDADAQTVSLVSGEAYEAGQQVFNNYGLKSNAELLLGYGFMLAEREDFHNDYVHIQTKPTDDDNLSAAHMVSLRPMSDPSSVVGRSRRRISPDVQVVPEFAYLQDSLITGVYDAIVAAATASAAAANPEAEASTFSSGDLNRDDLMAGRMPKAIHERLVQALGSKLSLDLDVLDEGEKEREDLNTNQKLAVQYRDQCRKVLENSLRALANAAI